MECIGSNKLWIDFRIQIFNQVVNFDSASYKEYGYHKTFDEENMILVEEQLCLTFPAILPDDIRAKQLKEFGKQKWQIFMRNSHWFHASFVFSLWQVLWHAARTSNRRKKGSVAWRSAIEIHVLVVRCQNLFFLLFVMRVFFSKHNFLLLNSLHSTFPLLFSDVWSSNLAIWSLGFD